MSSLSLSDQERSGHINITQNYNSGDEKKRKKRKIMEINISGDNKVGDISQDTATNMDKSQNITHNNNNNNNITNQYYYEAHKDEKKGARKKRLKTVVKEYKIFITEDQNSTLRSKIEQLKVEGKMCFIERKFKKERRGDGGEREKEDNPSLTTSELLDTLPRSKTTLVSAPSGTGKWAKSEQSINQHQLVLFLSSLQTNRRLELSKLVWGEFASRMRENSKLVYQELEQMKEKILIVIDGVGNNYCLNDDQFYNYCNYRRDEARQEDDQ